jgi:methionyl-tRNA synthetase
MYSPFMHGFSPIIGAFAGFALIIALWSLVWQGFALWHAARNKQWGWFIALLIVHTAGILDIIYLVFFRADHDTRSFRSLFPSSMDSMMPKKSPTTSPSAKEDATLPVAESSPE